MGTRLDLQMKLEELLGCRHVYYQPPDSGVCAVKMEYPAIRYSKSKIDVQRANNSVYKKDYRYDLIVISRTPDHPVIEKLLELPYCSYGKHYIADNLHHDTLKLYF